MRYILNQFKVSFLVLAQEEMTYLIVVKELLIGYNYLTKIENLILIECDRFIIN